MIYAFQHYLSKENNKITRSLFEKNIDQKLNDHAFMNDIGILLPAAFKATLAKPILTDNNNLLLTEEGSRMTTEGWSLNDAAEEIKNKLLCFLD